jgi:hypothetical protein
MLAAASNIGKVDVGCGQSLLGIELSKRVKQLMKTEKAMMPILIAAITLKDRKKATNQLYRNGNRANFVGGAHPWSSFHWIHSLVCKAAEASKAVDDGLAYIKGQGYEAYAKYPEKRVDCHQNLERAQMCMGIHS